MRDEAMVQRLSRAYMRSSIVEQLGLGLALMALPLATGCLDEGGLSLESTAAAAPSSFESNSLQTVQSTPAAPAGDQTPDLELSTAPVKLISTEKPLPPNIRLTSSLSELIRIAGSGVEENVMLAYVTNATGTFSLGSEEIIYLNDVGVPVPVIIAMLQHDQLMLSEAANAALAGPPAQPPPAEAGPPPSAPEPVTELAVGPPPAEPADAEFYDALAPYGTWIDVGGYGPCWQPSVAVLNPGWRPYCDRGHWDYTDCGWYWMSDYSWGWAPFHFGRWFCHASRGWCWAPDRVWGPSWVCWRYSNDYCGWAPLPPAACFRPGLGFIYGGHSVGFSFNFGIAASSYTFVPAKNFCDYRLARFSVPHDRVAGIYDQTVAVNKIVGDQTRIINHGIPADRIAALTHRPLRPATVRDANVAAVQGVRGERLEPGGRTLSVFRLHPAPVLRTPNSANGVARTDSETTRESTAAPVTIRGQNPAPLTAAPPNVPSRNPSLAAARTARPETASPAVSRAPEPWSPAGPANARPSLNESKRTEVRSGQRDRPPAGANRQPPATRNETARANASPARDVVRERTAPLIIRGPSRAPQIAAAPTQPNRVSNPAAGRSSLSEPAVQASRTQPQVSSAWNPPRLAEVQPRFERAAANDAL